MPTTTKTAARKSRPTGPKTPRATAVAEPDGYTHRVQVGGAHDPDDCPACAARAGLRDTVNTLMIGHPVDSIIILADFVLFAALETLRVERGDTLDDQKLGLRLLSVMARRLNDGILAIQDDVRRAESVRAIGPTRPQ